MAKSGPVDVEIIGCQESLKINKNKETEAEHKPVSGCSQAG